MNISDVTNILNDENKIKNANDKKTEEALKEAFKTIFVEQMVKQMLKTGNPYSGTQGIQKELYEEQLTKALSEQFMDASGIRWSEVLGYEDKVRDTEQD